MSEASDALERAKSRVGGNAGLAERLNITSQAVSQWGQVPVSRVLAVEAATGVRREELRPDIYPPAPVDEAAA